MLSLQLLGPPVIQYNGQPVAHFRSVKSLALLAYLAMGPGVAHSRSHLVTLFWPDIPENNGRQNLSQTLTRLRHTLGPAADMIVTTRQEVWLADDAAIELDVHTFQHLLAETETHPHDLKSRCSLCQEKLVRAVALVRGDLLPGLEMDDSPVFEEWLLLEREQIHHLLLRGLADLADGALANGRYETASLYARRQIALESWHEIAHRQLIQALALSGQRNAALAQYEQCRAILLQELGVEPTSATQQLATAVRSEIITGLASPPQTPVLPHNLPGRLTPFIGREAEMAALLERLTEGDDARLITITGPGGIGKTRLALEVGGHLLAHPPRQWALEGVWFVSLIGVSAAENLPVAIANTLDLPLPDKESAGTAVIQQLRPRQLLLILDNFEHLLDGRPWVLELLQTAPGVRLIVTSREHLCLLAEQRFALRGLAVPPDNTRHTEALDYDASRLFLDRTRRLYPSFRLSADNWPHVIRICHLTEGLPLGIELATILLEERSAAEVVAQIMADAAELAADYLDIAPHQRSIHLVFEQSWARLSTVEQRILSRLSIFESNGFSQTAALHVAGAQRHHLNVLVRKSLVQAQTGELYALHPLYKTFAARKLDSDEDALRQAHAHYFAQLLAEAVPPVFNKQKHLRLRSLLPLLPDLRACWQWAVTKADANLISALDRPLYQLLRETAQLQEGRALFEVAWRQLIEIWKENHRSRLQQTTLAQLSAHLGFFRVFCGDAYGARPCLEFALAEFDRLDIRDGRGAALTGLSDTLDRLGEYDARLALWQQELSTAEVGDDPLHMNRALGNLGEALYHMGRLAEARDIFLRTIETAPANVPDYDIAITINNLGLAELSLGNLPQARLWLEQSLQIRQQYANTYRIAAARRALGLLALAEGDYESARQQLETARAQYTQSGRVDGLGPVHLGLARLALHCGDLPTAEQQLRQALAYAVQLHSAAQGLNGLSRWGEYLWAAGRPQEALTLLGYVLGHKKTSGFLAREIRAFLTAHHVDGHTLDPCDDVDWQWWLQSPLFLGFGLMRDA